MTNAEIAQKLREMAAYYEMQIGATVRPSDPLRFKPRAYERAAEHVETFGEPIEELCRHNGEKTIAAEVPGVGPAIAKHICDIVKRGSFVQLDRERKRAPVHFDELLRVGGVGPRSVKILWEQLGVRTLNDLEKAAREGKIRTLERFGKRSEEKILRSINELRRSTGRHLLGTALPLARELEKRLRTIAGVKRATTAGSIRRMQETIGDIDILVIAENPDAVHERFAKMPEVTEIVRLGGGEGITSVNLAAGIRADVRILREDEYGAGLQYFTGDKNHNVALRSLAIKKGFKLSEYGLFHGKRKIAGRTEEEIYNTLGMDWIPPEIRSDEGEIDAARNHSLPNLIGYKDLQGDLQVQTDWTDGAAPIPDMVIAAKRAGLSYIAVTDHTVSLAMTGGLNEEKLAKQGRIIETMNKTMRGFRVLTGAEVNIGKDGSLDITDEALEKLDFVGASVHSHFTLSREDQTARVIKAIEHPHVDAIFHPTGRKIGMRKPLELDMDAIFAAAKKHGVALEVNGAPDRLDLRDEYVRRAIASGVKIIIDSDAHSPQGFSFLEYGIATARRGWAEKKDVLNALTVKELLEWLQKPKGKR